MARITAVVVAAVLLAGCGGKDEPTSSATTTTRTTPPAQTPPQERIPARVPRRGIGPADPASVRVIRAWLAALREGHVDAAARYFAIPSRVQNGTPVFTLRTRAEALVFNQTLPCGATADAVRSAGSFTIIRFRLTERIGGDCMGAAGHAARGAIRVRGRKIVEWYRLPDDPDDEQRAAPEDPGQAA
jgi:limonene-1,2-epoxide hydrolase